MTMLSPQFVGTYCGTSWRHVVHIKPQQHLQSAWSLPSLQKPPDPIRTVSISSEEILSDDDNTNDQSSSISHNVSPQKNHSYHINNFTYIVSKRAVHTTNQGALIDHGANGGLAGGDVCIINTMPDRFVDIQGIDNHQLNNIPIVTAEGVVNTQRGDAILVMHQYAHIPNGKTIHSSAQLEAHSIIVDDKAIKNGGQQQLITHGGYVIPLSVCSGLVYMDMHPPTDAEHLTLPHIILTSDLDWHPSSVDSEYDPDTWFDAMEDLPDLDYDICFDEYGDYIHTHELAATFTTIEQHLDLNDNYTINGQETINAVKQPCTSAPSPVNKAILTPKFGWLNWDIIQNTLDCTTQFYRAPKSNNLKKMYKSPYPACNIQC